MRSVGRVTAALLDVLEVLMSGERELYGLRISQLSGLKTGTVYPVLARLENSGWVESGWESAERTDHGPRRRFYWLNPDGVTAAAVLLAERRPPVDSRSRFRIRPANGLVRRLGWGTP